MEELSLLLFCHVPVWEDERSLLRLTPYQLKQTRAITLPLTSCGTQETGPATYTYYTELPCVQR